MDIEKHISNLKQYIKDDEIIEKDGSDFENFCKGHIDDIQAVLNELEKKDTVINDIVNTIVVDKKILALVCKHIINKTDEECENQNSLCDDCIKEYFYKKASDNK